LRLEAASPENEDDARRNQRCFHPPKLCLLSQAPKLVEREIPSQSAISTRIASSF
jgi:hypothetical protein